MLEKFKNLSFPVKFGLAILVPPLVCVVIACLYNFLLDRGCRATVSGCEMETVIPFFFILAAEFPLFLLLTRLFPPKDGSLYWLMRYMYPGRDLLLTILPALALWFIIGYLIGRVCNRFSPRVKKGCLTLLVVVPVGCLLLLSLILLLGV